MVVLFHIFSLCLSAVSRPSSPTRGSHRDLRDLFLFIGKIMSAARAVCDIRATSVGILRQSCRGEERRSHRACSPFHDTDFQYSYNAPP